MLKGRGGVEGRGILRREEGVKGEGDVEGC